MKQGTNPIVISSLFGLHGAAGCGSGSTCAQDAWQIADPGNGQRSQQQSIEGIVPDRCTCHATPPS